MVRRSIRYSGSVRARLQRKRAWQAIKLTPYALAPLAVSFGTKGGAGQLPLPIFNTVGAWFTSMVKGKTLFNDKWAAEVIQA